MDPAGRVGQSPPAALICTHIVQKILRGQKRRLITALLQLISGIKALWKVWLRSSKTSKPCCWGDAGEVEERFNQKVKGFIYLLT